MCFFLELIRELLVIVMEWSFCDRERDFWESDKIGYKCWVKKN